MSLQNHPNFYAIIPAHVRYCKELEPAAKLLYSEITALSNLYGYCWASNEYFAELYDVEVRTIQRWIETLKKNSFIEVELKKEGMKSSRKIWISKEIKEIFATRQKCHPRDDTRHDKNVMVDTAKMPSIVLQDTNNKEHSLKGSNPEPEKPTPIPKDQGLLFPKEWQFLLPIDIPDKEKAALMKSYSPDLVKRILECVTHPDFVIETTLSKVIFYYAKNPDHMRPKEEKIQEPDDEIDTIYYRKATAEQLRNVYRREEYAPHVNTEIIEFRHDGTRIRFNDKEFDQKFNKAVKSFEDFIGKSNSRPQTLNTSSQNGFAMAT